MALGDWTQQKGASDIKTDETQVYAGSSSLLFDNNTQTLITWDQSETDSPAAGEVRTKVYYLDVSEDNDFGAVFRFQDTNNYYAVIHQSDTNDITLNIVENGSVTIISRTNIAGSREGQWGELQFVAWENGSGDFTAKAKYDRDDDGNFEGESAHLTDTGNSKFAGGGAFGLAKGFDTNTSEPVWVDETEIYY